MLKRHFWKTKRAGQVKRFTGGRVCKKAGCKQHLSIYNLEEYCSVHRAEGFKWERIWNGRNKQESKSVAYSDVEPTNQERFGIWPNRDGYL